MSIYFISCRGTGEKTAYHLRMITAMAVSVLLLLAVRPSAYAESAVVKPAERPSAANGQEAQAGRVSVTRQSIKLNGKALNYTATAGYLHLEKKVSEREADIFFVSYVREGVADRTKRPLTFLFNGGPGASSIWLHLGAAGPKSMGATFEGKPLSPPYSLSANEYTWLDLSDLVFVDPVGAGYSRAAAGEDPKQFYGVRGDVESIGEFIRLYITNEGRWLSPKVLAGESYGTARAVLLAKHLHEKYGLDVSALVLISPVLNFQTFSFQPGNDLPYVMFLPTYAITAAYHNKSHLPKTGPGESLRPVEEWALDEYISGLAKGDAVPEDRKRQLIETMSSYTGLPAVLLGNSGLRVTNSRFARELLRNDNRTVGLMDSRFTSFGSPDNLFSDDPSFSGTLGSLASTLNDYVRNELGYKNELPYEYLSEKANHAWDWGSAAQGYLEVTHDLRDLINGTKYLRVFAAVGYYDLNTPYFASVYEINHLRLEPSLRKNVTLSFYEAGHQMYTDLPSLRKLKTDISDFYRETFKSGPDK